MSEIKKITAKHFGTWGGKEKYYKDTAGLVSSIETVNGTSRVRCFGNVTFSNQVNERFLSMAESEQIIWIE